MINEIKNENEKLTIKHYKNLIFFKFKFKIKIIIEEHKALVQ